MCIHSVCTLSVIVCVHVSKVSSAFNNQASGLQSAISTCPSSSKTRSKFQVVGAPCSCVLDMCCCIAFVCSISFDFVTIFGVIWDFFSWFSCFCCVLCVFCNLDVCCLRFCVFVVVKVASVSNIVLAFTLVVLLFSLCNHVASKQVIIYKNHL